MPDTMLSLMKDLSLNAGVWKPAEERQLQYQLLRIYLFT
jgi:hypothetical protein